MHHQIRCSALAILAALAVTACSSASHGPGTTAEEFLAWLRSHASDVGLVAYSPGNEAMGVFHHADVVFPLASVRKTLILGAYADAVSAGTLDPNEEVPLAAVERWFWPGTDGGVHREAIDDLRRSGRLHESGHAAALSLDDVVFAAIRWSDNAAADYLLVRIGADGVDRFVARHHLLHQEPIAPTLGELLAWTMAKSAAAWERLTPQQRAAQSWQAALQTSGAQARRHMLPHREEWSRFAHRSSGGTPREWAALLVDVFAREPADAAAALMRRHLEWPLAAYPQERSRFVHLAAKPGTIAGVRTEIVYIQPTSRVPMVGTLFLRHVDAVANAELGRSFLDQRFLIAMADNAQFFERVRAALP